MGHRFNLRYQEQIFHRFWYIAETVDEFVLHIHVFFLVFNAGNPLVNIQLLVFIFDIGCRNIGIDIAVYHSLKALVFLLPFKRQNCFVQQLAVEVVAHGLHVAVLFRSQYIACAAKLQIAHSNLDSASQLRKFPDSLKSFFRLLPQQLIAAVH